MYFSLTSDLERRMIQLPETGMGYQVIEARKSGFYKKENLLVLNGELVIEMNSEQNEIVRKIINEGTRFAKLGARTIVLEDIKILNKNELRNVLMEAKSSMEKGAVENPQVNASGEEIFVRLSAFDNDRRVDKINKKLLPGSFTTTEDDYKSCKSSNDDPVERYALPNNDVIQFAFYIQPTNKDQLQRGIVQPAYNKRGGGKEVYFANGTSNNTFIKQTPY